MKRYVLWGTKEGSPAWQEEVLLSDASAADCDRIIEIAKQQGFVNFRKTEVTNDPPDFRSCVNI